MNWFMEMFNREHRNAENPNVQLTGDLLSALLEGSYLSSTGEKVTVDTALGVPAIWSAVNFLSVTLASLPLMVYRETAKGRKKAVKKPIYRLLHNNPNGDWHSFGWRQYTMRQTLTTGRGYTLIVRNAADEPLSLWPLNPAQVKAKIIDGRKVYEYDNGSAKTIYEAHDIIDIPFALQADQVSYYSPIDKLKNAIGLSIALEGYAARFFQQGGVPPLSLEGPVKTHDGARKAGKAIMDALKRSRKESRNVLVMPDGHSLKQIGYKPEEGQLLEARRFQVEEVARIYNLPPVFLQDLTHGTFSNTEQQDLHFVKHTMSAWLSAWEGELNLKLFADRPNYYAEFNVDGLLRGDFVTRMGGLSQGIQNAIMTPNEARAKMNMDDKPGADELFIQQNMSGLQSLGEEQESQNAE